MKTTFRPLLVCKTKLTGATTVDQADSIFAAIDEFLYPRYESLIAWSYAPPNYWFNLKPHQDAPQGYVLFIANTETRYWCVRWNNILVITTTDQLPPEPNRTAQIARNRQRLAT